LIQKTTSTFQERANQMPKKREKKEVQGDAGQIRPLQDMRANERIFVDLHAAMQGRNFESVEQANAFLQAVVATGGPPRSGKITPLEKAQDIMYDAWGAAGKDRIDLAHKALAVSNDCADAYVLLAEEAASNEAEALQFLEEGVKAGEHALGERIFREEAGSFWGILETRPYMRARFGLAVLFHNQGERTRAIGHLKDLLRLNPNDNQGARHELAICLLEDGDHEALEKLLGEYRDECSAVWLYSRALLKFRQEGRSSAADTCLKEAFEQNPFVPQYLLGKKRLPAHAPEYMGVGDRNEAVVYILESHRVWRDTSGALEWMNKMCKAYRSWEKKGR
jgi:tetratricopeptide (TPR) repeat protein